MSGVLDSLVVSEYRCLVESNTHELEIEMFVKRWFRGNGIAYRVSAVERLAVPFVPFKTLRCEASFDSA